MKIERTEVAMNNMVVGSDEEKALTKAIKNCFSQADLVLCNRHLEENVQRFIQTKTGADDKSKQTIVKDIFGQTGLLAHNNSFDFENHLDELNAKFGQHHPEFLPYFRDRLTPLLRNHVFEPHRKHSFIPLNWKNNNCESINHILKLTCDWKTQKVTDLIEKLYRIVRLQYQEIRRALHGQGNLEVASWLTKMTVPNIIWNTKSNDEKMTHFQKFMKYKLP